MKTIFHRFLGIVLVVFAVTGMLLSLAGLAGVWGYKKRVETSLAQKLELLSTTLETTTQGLEIASQSLETSSKSITAIQTTLDSLAISIEDSTPMLDSLDTLLSDDLPATITSTQTSLASAQSSAKIIDGFLNIVSLILPGNPYNPAVPLHEALGQVSASLDGLPGSFTEMATSLETTNDNLVVIKANVELIATSVSQIERSLADAKEVVSQYQEIVTKLQGTVETAQKQLSLWLNGLVWISTLLLVWLGVMQVGLLLQGLDILATSDHEPGLQEPPTPGG